MREPFAPIPSGQVGLSRGYLQRLQGAASRASAGSPSLPYAGQGDDSTTLGQTLLPDPERWIFAKITEVPDEPTWPGYSWIEQVPMPDGTFTDAPDGEGLIGDNGSTSGTATMPAFPLAAGATFAVDDLVVLLRGCQHGGTESDSPGQEWLILSASGGGAGFEIVRIQGQFVKDDGSQTTCGGSPSPLCYYPGAIQKLTCAGWDAADGDNLVWVVFWYTYDAVDNGTDPPTVVIVDGTAAVDARPMGFTYAPNDVASELEYNGDSRPVYGSTAYARGWAMQCDPATGEPEITLGGS
jgi:hypothetical protein